MASDAKGIAIIIVGMTGTGKTYQLQRIINSVPKLKPFVFDVQRNVGEFPNNHNKEHYDVDIFLTEAAKQRNSIICFEEATSFFEKGGNVKLLRRMLVDKRHHGNVLVFLFHSIRYIPENIVSLCNYVVLLKTSDPEKYVRNCVLNSDKLQAGYEKVKNSPNKHEAVIIPLTA